MILYIDNPKYATTKLLELNEFGKFAGYKINTPKSVAFLYANKRSERDIQVAILFTITSKRIEYLGINLPKETKDLFPENTQSGGQKYEIKITTVPYSLRRL